MIELLLKLTLVIFMIGNLLGMGLRVDVKESLRGLVHVRFVLLTVLWGFVISPALAYLLIIVVPLEQNYAVGMLLLGMTPCAPFLPMIVERARADMAYAATLMLLTAVVTVIFMPLAVPLVVKGLTADAWTIAKPLLFLVLLPLAVGIAVKRISPAVAVSLFPGIRKTTAIATLLMLVLCAIAYGKDLASAVGSLAFGTQAVFFLIVTVAPYLFGRGLSHGQRSVLTLGMSTRNVGAAFAPLLAMPGVDQRAVVMVVIGVPMQVIASLLAARWLARRGKTVGANIQTGATNETMYPERKAR